MEAPEKRAGRLNLLWDLILSALVFLGFLLWLVYAPGPEGKGILVVFALPIFPVYAGPVYLMLIHAAFLLGLCSWAALREPELRPVARRKTMNFLLLVLAVFAALALLCSKACRH